MYQKSRQDAYDHGSGKDYIRLQEAAALARGYQRNNHQMDSDGAFFNRRGQEGPENTLE